MPYIGTVGIMFSLLNQPLICIFNVFCAEGVDIFCGLRIADCGLRIAFVGLIFISVLSHSFIICILFVASSIVILIFEILIYFRQWV
ncbi:hypothetical protein KV34_13345 [Klebsiella aerogenes]|nr:hypothetical protein KV34_13345 [Klebsiella aerogenes]